MENKFKIAKYTKIDDTFTKDGYDEYTITYLKGTKLHQLRIVVNGFLTKQVINILDCRSGFKNRILHAIKEYLDNGLDCKNKVVNNLTISFLERFYSKNILHTIKTYLLSINKEDSRDKLTEFGLVDLTNN